MTSDSPHWLVGSAMTSDSPHWLAGKEQELCESRGGRPGIPVSQSPYGLCGRKIALNLNYHYFQLPLFSELRSSQ